MDEKQTIFIAVAVIVVIVLILCIAYKIINKENYDTPDKTPTVTPAKIQQGDFRDVATKFIEHIQSSLPSLIIFINNKGFSALMTPENFIKTINSIINIQLALGQQVTVSIKVEDSMPTFVEDGYNAALLLVIPNHDRSLVLNFGKTLDYIANDMENLYKRIPTNQVPADLDLKAMENMAFISRQ